MLEPLAYEELRRAVLLCRSENIVAGTLDSESLEALIDLGIVVPVGEGAFEVTSHGQRLYRRLERGEHARELDPPPPAPNYD